MTYRDTGCILDSLIQMYATANLPVAITDNDLRIIWASDSALSLQPSLALPDGLRQLLHSYDYDLIKEEIAQKGAFSLNNTHNLFIGYSVTIYAMFPGQCDYYLAQPSCIAGHGTAMQPEGLNRTLTAFDAQYRTPIHSIFSSISGLTQNLSTQPSRERSDASYAYLEVISQNMFRLLRSCDWLSTHTRLANGLSPAVPKRVDLYGFLRELLMAASVAIEPLQIPLFTEIPDEILPVACDTDKLSLALLNILSNAARYTREGNHIEVRVSSHSDGIKISVTDHGAGIPSHVLSKVFDPYYSYNHDGHLFSGNGLGLAIAKEALHLLGGTIAITSILQKGTTVLLTLPADDDPSCPAAVFCDAPDYLSNRFSTLHIAFSDSVAPPMQ